MTLQYYLSECIFRVNALCVNIKAGASQESVLGAYTSDLHGYT